MNTAVNSRALFRAASSTGRAAGSRRILPIDAARGLVMLFSCLAHFAWWIHEVYPDIGATLSGIGMVATPTFLMLSGAMVGMLCATASQNGMDLRSQLFNRGLFLLTVGHFLIALSEAHLTGQFWRTMRGVTVVDSIGICTLTAAFFTTELANRDLCVRIARIGALVLGLAWLANVLWTPSTPAAQMLQNVLIGGNLNRLEFSGHTPLLQYLAIYSIGLPLGHFFASYVRREISLRAVAVRLATIGALLASVGVVLRLIRYLFENTAAFQNPAIELSFKVTEKIPPSPAYLLFFAGCGLMLIGTLFRIAESERSGSRAMLEWVAVIGRASLFVFVLQYFLFWTLPDLVNIHPGRFAAGLFIGNVLLVRLFAGVWGRVRGNRWMTFGIKLRGEPQPGG